MPIRNQLLELLDPFSIPAQMNNLGVLIIAYVCRSLHQETNCKVSDGSLSFLYFILYGSTIVCGGTFILTILYAIGVLDYCVSKIIICGQVCLTLNTLGVFLLGIIYHSMATLYGIQQIFFGPPTQCIELQMFKQVACTIYAIWFLFIIVYVGFQCYQSRIKTKMNQLRTNLVEM